ncbi:MAG TPA: DUF1674 domain-containing protein [Acetobacteraceae bacterium]|nr:DUF1674 domain-containing protein [Acetobacteraceae bacterium]
MNLAAEGALGIINTMNEEKTKAESPTAPAAESPVESPAEPKLKPKTLPKEIGGPSGPEPTRYGDWQYKGRVTDF